MAGHTLLPRDGETTPLPLIEGMRAIQDLLEVLHQSEMVTTAAGHILQVMAMAMILMKMAMGLASKWRFLFSTVVIHVFWSFHVLVVGCHPEVIDWAQTMKYTGFAVLSQQKIPNYL